jgi:hypothetical protein
MMRSWFVAAIASAAIAAASQNAAAQPAAATAPILTLDAAIDYARQHNRPLLADRIEVDKAAQRLAAFRTQKKPLFDVRVTSGTLLFPMNFQFPVGSFGVFPTTGN